MAGPPYQQGRRKVSWEDGSVSYETPARVSAIKAAEAKLKIKPTSSMPIKQQDQGHVAGGVVSRQAKSVDAFKARLVAEARKARK